MYKRKALACDQFEPFAFHRVGVGLEDQRLRLRSAAEEDLRGDLLVGVVQDDDVVRRHAFERGDFGPGDFDGFVIAFGRGRVGAVSYTHLAYEKADPALLYYAGYLLTVDGSNNPKSFAKGGEYLTKAIDLGYADEEGNIYYYLFHCLYGQKDLDKGNIMKAKDVLLDVYKRQSSPCCCSCRASTASANFDADVDRPVFFSGNGRPQAVPFAFSPGSLPGDFFRGVEVVGAMVANPAQMPSCRAVCRRRMQGGWGV